MSGVNNFDLQIHGNGAYSAGEEVKGQVIINSSMETLTVKNIQVELRGFGEVLWTEKVI